MHSTGPTVMSLIFSKKYCVFYISYCALPTKGLRMPGISLATPYVTDTLFEIRGLNGMLFVYFGKRTELGRTHSSEVHPFIHVVIQA